MVKRIRGWLQQGRRDALAEGAASSIPAIDANRPIDAMINGPAANGYGAARTDAGGAPISPRADGGVGRLGGHHGKRRELSKDECGEPRGGEQFLHGLSSFGGLDFRQFRSCGAPFGGAHRITL